MSGSGLPSGARIQRLAWAMATACILALLVGYVSSSWLSKRIETDRIQAEQLGGSIAKCELSVRSHWRELSQTIDQTLNATSSAPGSPISPTALHALGEELQRYDDTIGLVDGGSHQTIDELNQSLPQISTLVSEAQAWRASSVDVDAQLESSIRGLEKRFRDIGASMAGAQGRTKLEAIKILRGSEPSLESEPGKHSDTLKSLLLVQSSLSLLGIDLAEVQSAASRIMRIRDLGMLSSLEQNDLRPSLARMASTLRQSKDPNVDWSALAASLSELSAALLVQPPGPDSTPRTPSALELRRDSLAIASHGEALRGEWTSLKDHWGKSLPALQGSRDSALLRAEAVLERRLANSHTWMRNCALLTAAVVLLLCWRIGRSIRVQVVEMEALTTNLAAANTRMHAHVAALESAPDGILIASPTGEQLWANSAYRGLTEKRPAEAGAPLLPGCEIEGTETRRILAAVCASGERWSGHRSGRRADGSKYTAAQSMTPVRASSGEVVSLVSLLRDVTVDLRREEQLRELHEENELILNSLSALLISTDTEGRVTSWNAVATRILEREGEPPLGVDIAELALPWTAEPVLAALRASLLRKESSRLESIPVRTTSGKLTFLGLGVSPIIDDQDQLRGCLILGRDITQQRALELQLQQAQKLESIGQLAAGIAHEINTPTQFINDNTRFVRDAFAELGPLLECCRRIAGDADGRSLVDELRVAADKADLVYLSAEVPRALEESLGGIARVASIVKAMKQFSHPGTSELESINLNQALESTVTVARNEWKYVAEMELDLAADLPPVPCHPGELNQAVLNMIVNAAHAIGDVVKQTPGKLGRIRIQTRCSEDVAIIRISDTGGGIPEGIRQRIFDPFFTTKEVGKGTGQGLAIARSVVVDKHKGRIDVESEVGKGTTFTIEIPLHQGAGEGTGAPALQEAAK